MENNYRVTPPFRGSWAQAFIYRRDRFMHLMAMLYVSELSEEVMNDRLRKIRWLSDHVKQTCKAQYQPDENISVDECIVCMKQAYGPHERPQSPETTHAE